jgi:SIR2-like domain
MTDHMAYYLLTGAGFSRNWGGWLADEAFEYLLGQTETDPKLREYLWNSRDEGRGFEDALAWLQYDSDYRFDAQVEQNLRNLTSALLRMFAAMGRGFQGGPFEFQDKHVQRTCAFFLSQFDAIFTVNQDTLLESRYFHCLTDRFVDCYTPGVANTDALLTIDNVADPYFVLKTPDTASFSLIPHLQPYFKLHGSIDWITKREMLLILGGSKEESIKRHPILTWYHEEFLARITVPNARIMVIGYSFRDDHINRALIQAAHAGAHFFVIDINGTDAMKQNKLSMTPNTYEMLRRNVIGASRRPLSEIFGSGGTVEFGKLEAFFRYNLLHRAPREAH